MQQEIVKQAIAMLKQGGKMIYSTCTFSPEENEQIIAWILQRFPQMHLIAMRGYEGFAQGRPDLADGNPELTKCVRIWPHRMDGEGHFVALLQKGETTDNVENSLDFPKKVENSQGRHTIGTVVP